MSHKNRKTQRDDATRASVTKEMAKPRMASSAKIAELNLDTSRIPEQPGTTVSGIVNKIIMSPHTGQPEKAQIAVVCGDRGLGEDHTDPVEAGDCRFPSVQIDDLAAVDRIIPPLCDQAHQMCGREGSPNFNVDEVRIERGR